MADTITVPLLDLKAQYATLKDDIVEAMHRVADAQWFVMGPEVKGLEEEIAAYCRAKHAIGCASGSDAVLLALWAYGIGPGDEVICPSYTFFATAGSIARLGATPVFADIDPVTYNMDIDQVRDVVGCCRNLKAIMPVHLFGQAVDMDAYLALGKELNVPIIEDAAQAIGTMDATGAPAGSRGDIGCFSFFPSKNLGGFGDGGIMTTNDDELNEKLSILRLHGGKPKYYHRMIGMNSRLDALQAAILRIKLQHLEAWHAGRQANAKFYDEAFSAIGAKDSSEPLSSGGFPVRYPWCPPAPSRHIYNQYVIRVPADQRDALRAHMGEQNIGTEIYYPVPLHMQECFSYLNCPKGSLPHSELAAAETIALPIYPELTVEQKTHVVNTVHAFLAKTAAVGA